MSEEDRLAAFIQGLRPKTRVEIFLKKVTTLEKAILVASSMEAVIGNRPKEINFVKLKKRGFLRKLEKIDIKCFKCGKRGHVSKNCRANNTMKLEKETNSKSAPSSTKNTIKSDMKCFKCGYKGHKAADCRVEKKFKNKTGSSANVVSVNIVELFDKVPNNDDNRNLPWLNLPNSSMSEYWTAYAKDRSREGSWHKYDKLILNYVIHSNKDYCHRCLELNEMINRELFHPLRCFEYYKETYNRANRANRAERELNY